MSLHKYYEPHKDTKAKPAAATFPSWYFGPGGARKIVQDQAELDALGPTWRDSPADVEEADKPSDKK